MKVRLIESVDSKGTELNAAQEHFFRSSKVRNSRGELLVVYRGTVAQTDRNYFRGDIKWFTEDYNYAKKYNLGSNDKIYECYLNCKHIFDCGNTNYRLFKLNPTKLELTDAFMNLLKRLNVTEKYFVSLFEPELKNSESYRWFIYSIVRTSKFGDLVRRSGYDCIHTIEEDGSSCYGALYDEDIKLVSNKNPGISSNINESLDESLRSLGSDIYVTYNVKDVIDLLSSTKDDYRIIYDEHEKMFLLGKAYDIIHFDLLNAAWDKGYFDDQMDFINEYVGSSVDNYRDLGEDGFYINEGEDNEEWVDQWLYSFVYVVKEDEVTPYEGDGWNHVLETSLGGYILTRNFEDAEALKSTPLSQIILTNKSIRNII